jgi:nitroreductase
MIRELAEKNRSYRRFYQDKKITEAQLLSLVDTARITPSAANKQPLKYKVVCDETENEKVFQCIGWAGYLKDWDGPEEGERPTGYIIMAVPEDSNAGWDEGIAGQTIMLAAVEQGLGGCFIGNLKRKELAEIIGLPANYRIDLCLALGYPKEEVVLENMDANGDVKYYRDAKRVHHVPKRRLKDVLL